MLKKGIILSTVILSSTLAYGKYEPWNFTVLEGSLIKGTALPNGWGESSKDVIFELQGTTRYDLLDLYWFVDRSNILNDKKLSDKKGVDNNYTYGEISPRISLDGLLNKDLSIGPINEWFIATQFDFDNVHGKEYGKNKGLRKYYVGIGNYITIPQLEFLKFDYFKTNLYARYIDKNYGRNEDKWDGYLLNLAYGGSFYQFKNGMKLGFSGWLDYDFGARSTGKETSDSLQWQNQVRLYLTKNISVSYTYQINNHFSQVNQYSSNKNNESFGLHYAISF
ncbi:outer membrane protein OmpK [Cetobacterium sp. SF1]|uniref:outer membrane protein OmpK n=1 Tax=unclassified Cetobacterium TaxID=2630983 RepID=UPI003CF2D6A1